MLAGPATDWISINTDNRAPSGNGRLLRDWQPLAGEVRHTLHHFH